MVLIILTPSNLAHDQCAGSCLTTRSCTTCAQNDVCCTRRQSVSRCSRSWRLPCHGGGARLHALWECSDHCFIPSVVPLFDLASCLKVHSLPEVHATGSTVHLASKITEMSNKYVVTPTSSYVNIIKVGNVGDGLHQRI